MQTLLFEEGEQTSIFKRTWRIIQTKPAHWSQVSRWRSWYCTMQSGLVGEACFPFLLSYGPKQPGKNQLVFLNPGVAEAGACLLEMVDISNGCETWLEMGFPPTPFGSFRISDSGWIHIRFQSFSLHQRIVLSSGISGEILACLSLELWRK